MSQGSENENGKSGINDKYQFVIAMTIIVPFISFIGIFYWNDMTSQAKDILTTLGALVGTIVGFYFGQRPIQSLTQQVSEAKSETEKTKGNLKEMVSVTQQDSTLLDNLREQVKVRDELIASLKSKMGT